MTFELYLGIICLHSSRLIRRQVEIIVLYRNCFKIKIRSSRRFLDESCYI